MMLKKKALKALILVFITTMPLSLISMDTRYTPNKHSTSNSSSSSSSSSASLLPKPVLPKYIYNAARFCGPENYRTVQIFITNHPLLINAPFPEQRNNTLLHVAALNNCLDIVELLLGADADINASTYDGQTPLMAAAQRGNRQVIKLILKRHPEAILQRDTGGRTALMAAVVNADIETIKLLLARGASINARTVAGVTALNMANDRGDQQIIRYLLSKEAKTYPVGTPNRLYRSSSKMRAAQEAKNKSAQNSSQEESLRKGKQSEESEEKQMPVCEDATEALQELTVTPQVTPETLAEESGEALSQETLVIEGPIQELYRAVDRELHDAVERNNRADALRALRAGANINSIVDGQTVLHRASYNGYLAFVEFLLDHGASYAIRNAAGLAPEQVARNANIHRLFIDHYWASRTVRNVLKNLGLGIFE